MLAVPWLRLRLAHTPGLRFWRLLGSGRGVSMTPAADLARWALFAVWDDTDSLARFVAADRTSVAVPGSPVIEAWHGGLELRRARGAWGGVRLLPAASPPPAAGPVAVLTRAAVRPARLRRFVRAAAAVEPALLAAPGRLRSVGVGEWPLLRQATFSLWSDETAMQAFAARGDAHREVVRRTVAEAWYAEELFARFTVRTLAGTWAGEDPLPVLSPSPRGG